MNYQEGDRVIFLVTLEGKRATVQAGTVGIVTGQQGRIISVRTPDDNLWLCWPEEIKKQTPETV